MGHWPIFTAHSWTRNIPDPSVLDDAVSTKSLCTDPYVAISEQYADKGLPGV